MGGSKFRNFIKRKIGLEPVIRCSICFDFVHDEDGITEEVFPTLGDLHNSADEGCFTCGLPRDAVAGVFGTERFPLTQPISFMLGYGAPTLYLSDLDHTHWSRPTIEFYNTSMCLIPPQVPCSLCTRSNIGGCTLYD